VRRAAPEGGLGRLASGRRLWTPNCRVVSLLRTRRPIAGVLDAQEGRSVDGRWKGGRWLNGDEIRQGRRIRLACDRLDPQRVRLCRDR